MFDFDDKDIQRLEKQLNKFNAVAVPIAIERTLVDTGFDGMRAAKRNVNEQFTLRNKFTEKSIRVDKTFAKARDVNKKQVILGSVAEYMAQLELGGIKKATGRHGVPIPTAQASGEGDVATPKRRLPRAANRLNRVRYGKKSINKTRRQRNVALVKQAKAEGDKFVFLETSRSKGIYSVRGTKRKPKIKMLYDLSKKSYTINKQPWLMPASLEAVKRQPGNYRRNLEQQIRRNGLFK